MKPPILTPEQRDFLLGDTPRHCWLRMGSETFCAKIGCGKALTEGNRTSRCEGEETETVRTLRSLMAAPGVEPYE